MADKAEKHCLEILDTKEFIGINTKVLSALKNRSVEFECVRHGRGVIDYMEVPRLRTPRGFVVSGERILIYLEAL